MAEEARDTPQAGLDLGQLLGGMLGGGQSGGAASDAVSDGIGAVLRDPEMMAKLPAMIEMLRPMMGDLAGGARSVPADAEKTEEAQGEKQEEAAVALSKPFGGKGKSCHERRVALLCALRPYLNPRRQEAIDYILRMDQMGKLFRQR